MKIYEVISEQLADKTQVKYGKNKDVYTYQAGTNSWVNKNGQPASGMLAGELFKAVGFKNDGQSQIAPGLIQRAKNYFSGKTDGMAQATRKDPNASIGKKIAGIAGAALGGALAGGKPKPTTNAPQELPANIKTMLDNLTKGEKQYVITKLTKLSTATRGASNAQLTRQGQGTGVTTQGQQRNPNPGGGPVEQ